MTTTSHPDPDQQYPYRIVDCTQRGWHHVGDGVYYSFPIATGDGWPYDRIVDDRGPIRPVRPAPAEHTRHLRLALAAAHQAAVASALVGLHAVYLECMSADGGPHRLIAGRPGSWESDLLLTLAQSGPDVANANVARILDDSAMAWTTDIIRRWVFDPNQYVEVAENLATVFGQVVDGRGGWNEVITADLATMQVGRWAYRLFDDRATPAADIGFRHMQAF